MNLSTLSKELSSERGEEFKVQHLIGTNGIRYDQKLKNEALNMLRRGQAFTIVKEVTGVSVATLRRWYNRANPKALVA